MLRFVYLCGLRYWWWVVVGLLCCYVVGVRLVGVASDSCFEVFVCDLVGLGCCLVWVLMRYCWLWYISGFVCMFVFVLSFGVPLLVAFIVDLLVF